MTAAKRGGVTRERFMLTRDEARALTTEIVGELTVSHERFLSACDRIIRAFRGCAWNALGYTSWQEYCETEFQSVRSFKLSDDQIREYCSVMMNAGMSVRAIAYAIGVSVGKVHKERPRPDEGATIMSLDGKRRSAAGRKRAMEAHPSGKRLPTIAFGAQSISETILLFIAESGGAGLTYVELCEIMATRDAPVTGALAGLKRYGKIVPGWVRDGNTAWVAAGTDPLSAGE